MAAKKQSKLSHKALLTIIEQAAREGTVELDLSGKGISVLPPEIGQLTSLTHLNLSNSYNTKNKNQLTELPPEIGQLTNLQSINLDNNQLTTLPEAIGQLTNLRSLNFDNNGLTTLPEAISNRSSNAWKSACTCRTSLVQKWFGPGIRDRAVRSGNPLRNRTLLSHTSYWRKETIHGQTSADTKLPLTLTTLQEALDLEGMRYYTPQNLAGSQEANHTTPYRFTSSVSNPDTQDAP